MMAMKKLILSMIVPFAAIVSAFAVEPGYEALPFLRITRDPSAITGGAAQASASSGAYSVFSNPVLPAFVESKGDVALSYTRWKPSASNNIDFGGSFKFGEKFGISAGFSYSMGQKYDVYNKLGNVSGTFTPSDMIAGLGLHMKFTDFLAAGANVKYASSSLAKSYTYGAVAADLFVAGMFNDFIVTAGVSDIGTKVASSETGDYSLPTALSLGLGYGADFGPVNAKAQLAADYYFSGALTAGIGTAFSYNDLVTLRLGYNYGGKSVIPSYASIGLGAKFAGISIDAAMLLASEALGGTMMFGVRYSF